MQLDLQKCAAVASRMSGKAILPWIRSGAELGLRCTLSSVITQAKYFELDWYTYLGLARYNHESEYREKEKSDDGEATRELNPD